MLFDSDFLITNIFFNHFLIVITFVPFLTFLFIPQKKMFYCHIDVVSTLLHWSLLLYGEEGQKCGLNKDREL